MTTFRAPGMAATNRSAWAIGIQRSSSPHEDERRGLDAGKRLRDDRRPVPGRGAERADGGEGARAARGREVLREALGGDASGVVKHLPQGRLHHDALAGQAGEQRAGPGHREAHHARPLRRSEIEARGVDQHQGVHPLRPAPPRRARRRLRPCCCRRATLARSPAGPSARGRPAGSHRTTGRRADPTGRSPAGRARRRRGSRRGRGSRPSRCRATSRTRGRAPPRGRTGADVAEAVAVDRLVARLEPRGREPGAGRTGGRS